MTTSALIHPDELRVIVDHGDARILDASYGLPPAADGIPGAIDFDIDDVADPQAPLAHTIPSPELFAEKASRLGIGAGDAVIVYDRAGLHMAAARAWWMFRLFGHDNVRVLDGGLPAWTRGGHPLAPKGPPPTPKKFPAAFRPHLFKTRVEMAANLGAHTFDVLDARDPARFSGNAPEPRPGLAPGHIPQSASLPFASLLDPATARLLPPPALAAKLAPFRGRAVACTCGSGVTACVLALGFFEAGMQGAAVYGGSWAEWGADPALPKAKGAA